MMLIFLFVFSSVISYAETQKVETRQYVCQRVSPKSSKTECRLRFGEDEEFASINDNGCFMNFDSIRNEPVELCPLQCKNHNKAVLIKTDSQCDSGVERRQSDWFMYRSPNCQNDIESSFTFECTNVAVELIENHIEPEISEEIEVQQEQGVEEAEDNDDLPDKVDTVLGFMFPEYRRIHKQQ
ncbi:unnamed protein product [Caenorhabditis angaria]|uniref:DUF7808 domain-containing protein n=1 Tax=Caenorhabditis angaria TaxID=860376 RepID=A0A9P1MSQ1_9PELO|nr:unnamed protein product [Caenorhabditis angaria]